MTKFTGSLRNVETDDVIVIAGRTTAEASRFDVDLQSSGSSKNSTLHISVRFDEDAVVRSVERNGKLEGEEHEANFIPANRNPLKPGENFKIAIYVDEKQFLISLNEKPFCAYAHRFEIRGITAVEISLDIERIIQFHHFRRTKLQTTKTLSCLFPSQCKPGNVIVLTATPRGDPAGRFLIDLLSADSEVLFQLRSTMETVKPLTDVGLK